MLVAMSDEGSVLLERRPESGIWGGLWCLPEFETDEAARVYAAQRLHGVQMAAQPLAGVEHSFTHFDLVVAPLLAHCSGAAGVMDAANTVWYNPKQPAPIGLPAPIKTLLEHIGSPTMF